MIISEDLPRSIRAHEIKLYIKDDGVPNVRVAEWVDFSERWDAGDKKRILHKLGPINQSSEGKVGVNSFQTSAQSVTFSNLPIPETGLGFFDVPIPKVAGTLYGRSYPTILSTVNGNTAYFTYSRGYEQTVFLDREVKIDLRITLINLREIDIPLGVFLFGGMSRDDSSGLVNAGLVSFSKKLQAASAEKVKDGVFWHVNKPVAFLVRELLESVFGSPLPADWDIPPRIAIETAQSLKARIENPEDSYEIRALSAFGRPPDYNGTLWLDLGLIPRWMEIWHDGTSDATPTVTCYSQEDYGFFLLGNNTNWYSETGISVRPGDSIVIRNSANGNDGSYEIDENIKPINPTVPEKLKLKKPLRGTVEANMEFSIVRLYFAVSEDVWAFNPETQVYRRVTTWSLETTPSDMPTPTHPDGSPQKYGHARRIWYNSTEDHLYVVSVPDLLDTFEGEILGEELHQYGILHKISDNMKNEEDFRLLNIAGFGGRTSWQMGPITNGNYIFHQGRGHYLDKGGTHAEENGKADMALKMCGTIVLKFRAEDLIIDGTKPYGVSVQGFAYNDDGNIYIGRGENFLLPFPQVPKYANTSPYLGKRLGFQKPDTDRHWMTKSDNPQYIETLDPAYTPVPWPDTKPGLEAGIDLGSYATWGALPSGLEWLVPKYISNDMMEGPDYQKMGDAGTRGGDLVKPGYWAFSTAPLAGDNSHDGTVGVALHFQRSMWWMFSQGQQGVILYQPDYGASGAIIFPRMESNYTWGLNPTEGTSSSLMLWDIATPTGAVALSCMSNIKTSDADIALNYVGTYPMLNELPVGNTAVDWFSYTCGCVRPGTDKIYLGLIAPTDYYYRNEPTPGGDNPTKKFLWENTELWVWRSIIVEVDTATNTRKIEWKSSLQGGVVAHQDEVAYTILEMAYDEGLDRLIVIGLNRRGFEPGEPENGEYIRLDTKYFIGFLQMTGAHSDIDIPSENFWFIGQPQGLVKDEVSGNWYFTVSGSNTLWVLTINEGNKGTLLLDSGFSTIDGDGYLGSNLILDPYTRGNGNPVFNNENVIVYGCSRPSGDPEVQDGLVNGKFYLWKYDRYYTTRIELADFKDMNVWQALGALAQLTDHIMGFVGNKFYFIQREHLSQSSVTYSEDSLDYQLKSVTVKDGLDEVYNYASITPFEVVYQSPEIEATIRGREEEDPAAEFEFAANQAGVRPKRATLRCVKSGPLDSEDKTLDSALFIYKVTGSTYQTELSVAYLENDAPYKVYISRGIGDVAPGDFLEITWEDELGEQHTSEGIVYGEINYYEGSLFLRNGFSNLPELGFEVGQKVIVKKTEQFSNSISRVQFPHENHQTKTLYPRKVWNTIELVAGTSTVWEQGHHLVIDADQTVDRRCFVYHITSGWENFYIEGQVIFWHKNDWVTPKEAVLVIRYIDTLNYVTISIKNNAGNWDIEGRQVVAGVPVVTQIYDITGAGGSVIEGEDYVLGVEAKGNFYDVYFGTTITFPAYGAPTATWDAGTISGHNFIAMGFGRCGVGGHQGFYYWDYVSFWTAGKTRQFLLEHFGELHPYHERIRTINNPRYGATYNLVNPLGEENYYELYHGDEANNPSDIDPFIVLNVEDMKGALDATIWLDFMIKNSAGEENNELDIILREVNTSYDYRICFSTRAETSPMGGNAHHVKIYIGSDGVGTRFWTSVVSDSGLDWVIDRDNKYRARVDLQIGGKIGVTLWDLEDLTNAMNGIPIIFARNNDAGIRQDPDWPYTFEEELALIVRQSNPTPVASHNFHYARIYNWRVYPGHKSAPNYAPRYFPNEYTETLVNAKYHQIGDSGLYLKITDPAFTFYLKQLVANSYDRDLFENSLLNLSNFMDGDLIIVDAPGWELIEKAHSQIMHQSLPSQQIYGRLEFPSLSNRFFTPRIAKDVAARVISLFAFPTYTLDVDVLLDPMLSFLSEASGRRSIYIRHEKLFAASQNRIQRGYLRSISHNHTSETTTFVFKSLDPY